ncbi:MAG: LytTR family DNA-binding domain-containing protein [Aurantibacter sp.]
MNFFDKIVQTLRKPFPEEESSSVYYRALILFSVFVTLFLYIFEPFGISIVESELGSNKFLICAGFGAMTFLGTVVYEFIAHKILSLKGRAEKWTFGKWILNMLGIMFSISLANFLFARLSLFGFIDWNLFPAMIYGTFMVGIIPVVAFGAWSLFKNEKKYQNIANEINQTKTTPTNGKNIGNPSFFDIPTHQIRYIEALQNYAKIGYIGAEGFLKVKTERITLKRILAETEGTAIIKCHRSFLVNKDAIIATAGNAQGLLLSLSDCDTVIPVSRSRVPVFRQL